MRDHGRLFVSPRTYRSSATMWRAWSVWALVLVGLLGLSLSGCQCGGPSLEPVDEVITQTDAGGGQESVGEEAVPEEAPEKGCPPGQHSDGQGGCTSDPCLPDPCKGQERSRCVAENDKSTCKCPSGTHEEEAACVKDQECKPDTCNNHGQCSVNNGKVGCSCSKGYTGPFCDKCDTQQGYVPSPVQPGTCTMNPCDPNPCKESIKTLCRVEKGKPVCECNAGTHDENGKCVPDQTCQKNTCNGHGVCEQRGKTVVCRCQPGYQGDFCDKCDAGKGYHADGKGGCTDDPCIPNPCKAKNQTVCKVESQKPTCLCDAGFHLDGGSCVKDETCMPNSCNGNGTCSVNAGVVVCKCTTGYIGPYCSKCDTSQGYHSDGKGGCTNDPCIPNPCKTTNQTRCKANNQKAECLCDIGTHDENGKCVADKKCEANTCNQHGTCSENQGRVSCKCNVGYTGPFCSVCDKSKNYHSDGKGGCTNDPCTPNPCNKVNKTVCKAQGVQAICSCNTGYHLDNQVCVKDEVCQSNTCSGKGSCSVVGGRTQCKCNMGYTGKDCSQCDKANNYHPDGKGGCTNDPCIPNPCKQANKTVCKSSGLQHQCSCDAGYHSDGKGGCTNDPCIPDPCLAQNKACRKVNGQAQCYTPPCNDNNPCTQDLVSQGKCVHNKLPDNTSCQTSLCLTGETCQQGQCTGGNKRICNDKKPCTRDSCDPTKGCQHVNDDTIVPDDGFACTVDKCSQGIATHTPDDARCDDGKYCTGVESCNPKNSGANAQGCIATNVPQAPPAPGPCQSYGACDEATKTFPLTKKSPGDACNDGIACTQQDQCNAQGVCVGTPIPNCSIALCQSPVAFQATINLPTAVVSGTFTLNGQPLPTTAKTTGSGYFYLRAVDTKKFHRLAEIRYSYDYSSKTNKLYGGSYDVRIVPGIYDIYYQSYTSGEYVGLVSSKNTTLPAANRVLKTGVVIGQGSQTLDVDLPTSTVTGTFTLNGQPLPATAKTTGSGYFYLRAVDTKKFHRLAEIRYSYDYSSKTNKLYGGTYNVRITPGTYDLYYHSYTSGEYVGLVSSKNTTLPAANRVLKTGVVITKGSQTINFDLPTSTVNGTFTLNGQALPATAPTTGSGYFYLRSTDTHKFHRLAEVRYSYDYSSKTNKLYGGTYDVRISPGTYDLYYHSYTSGEYVGLVRAKNTLLPAANRVLKTGVVVKPGAQTINFDLPTSTVNGTFTLNGQALPATASTTGSGYFYLRSTDTHKFHRLAEVRYSYDYSSKTNKLYGGIYDVRISPGTYDLYYHSYTSGEYVGLVRAKNTTLPAANRLLKPGVVVKPGAQTINFDLPTATLSGTFTLNGQALPSTSKTTGSGYFYLRSTDTQKFHRLAEIRYSYDYSSKTNKLYGGTYDVRITPGTYDLYYHSYTSGEYVGLVRAKNTTLPAANRLLKKGVVVKSGSNSMDFDLPTAVVAGSFTLNGQALPTTSKTTGSGYFYLRSVDTKKFHRLAEVRYSYDYSSKTNKLYGGTYDARLTPGLYQVYYQSYTSGEYVGLVRSKNTLLPAANRVLQYCVQVK